MVLTSSANAVVPKRGTRGLRREQGGAEPPGARAGGDVLAAGAGERDQSGDGGEGLDDVSAGPRDGVADEVQHRRLRRRRRDDELRNVLAQFYAKRTLTHVPIDPKDCAEAILFLGGPHAPLHDGALIPVDGGLTEAYLR